ncbi:MAG: substrate-binding domain-containing protein [bacterium]|nr:substrate-binding domain-containing protein [bacterium]MDE0601642.1 substrate-binding domain-containing protein [bacterium]
MGRRSWLAAVLAAGLAAGALTGCSPDRTRVTVVAGTTLVDGRLLERVTADYEAGRPGVRLSVVGAPTARALALAEAGSADVTITHDPALEERFISEGRAELASEVFSSRFILAGPPQRAGALGGVSAVEAFRRIAEQGHSFVSRVDGSGTYQVEREIWDRAGVDPAEREWYVETRQGMGLTLQVASQRDAFVLVEVSVFLTAGEATGLVDAALDPAGLANPYRAMAVKGSPVSDEALAFVGWLGSQSGRESVRRANLELYGAQIFEP